MNHRPESINQGRIESPDRRHTDSLKWARYGGSDIIPMWVADMDFKCAPEILAALHSRVDHGVFGYTVSTKNVTAAVVNWTSKRHNWSIDPQWIVWVPGLVPALSVVSQAFANPSQSISTFTPIYPPFLTVPKFWNRGLVTCPLDEGVNGFQMNSKTFLNTLTPETRVLLLCSPHNPVGRVWTKEELTAIAEVCLEREILICSDEIHCDLVLDRSKKHIPTATLSDEIAQHTITLMSPAKTFNLPGLNCGFAVIPNDKLRFAFKKTVAGMLPHVNTLGYTACQAAFTHGSAWLWLADVLEYLRENHRLLLETMNQIPNMSMFPVEATYLAWIDIRRLHIEKPVKKLEEAGVGVLDGADFGKPGFIRVNFACQRDLLKEGISRLTKVLRQQ